MYKRTPEPEGNAQLHREFTRSLDPMDDIGKYNTVKRLAEGFSGSVLEVACGTGSLSFLIALKDRDVTVKGTDISPTDIAYAQKQFTLPNLFYAVQDVYQLEEADHDLVVCWASLHHFEHPKLALEKMTNAGKKVFVYDFSRDTPEDIVDKIARAEKTGQLNCPTMADSIRASYTASEVMMIAAQVEASFFHVQRHTSAGRYFDCEIQTVSCLIER